MIDITERKRQEDEERWRRETQSRFQREIFELAQLDREDLTETLRTLLRRAARLLQVERLSFWLCDDDYQFITCRQLYTLSADTFSDELVSLRAADYPNYFAALRDLRIIRADEALTDKRTREFAESYLKPLGITSMLDVPVWVRGRPVGVLCHEHVVAPRRWTAQEQEFVASVGQLITLALEADERRRAAAALRESEERLRLAASAAGFGMYRLDVATGRNTWTSEIFDIFGLPAQPEMPLDRIRQHVHSDDRERVMAAIGASLDPRGLGLLEDGHRIIRPDGTVRWILVKGRTHFEGEGDARRPVYATGTLMDITERVRAEREAARTLELSIANTELAKAARAKDEFLANMSHKLRTPLNGLIAPLQMLADPQSGMAGGEVAEIAEIALHSIQRLSAEIMDILSYVDVRGRGNETEGFRLAELRSVIAEIAAELKLDAVAVNVSDEVAGLIVALSPRAVDLVLRELLANAQKFHPRRAPRVEITVARRERCVSLRVADDGVSLSPQQAARVWTPYYQGEKLATGEIAGMGLGLPMVASLVWEANGTYCLHNREDGPGVVVELNLPISEEFGSQGSEVRMMKSFEF